MNTNGIKNICCFHRFSSHFVGFGKRWRRNKNMNELKAFAVFIDFHRILLHLASFGGGIRT